MRDALQGRRIFTSGYTLLYLAIYLEVFSVCSQPVENLSAFLQYSYLGPIVNSGVLKWRLRDTKSTIQFIHHVNDHIKKERITTAPSICCVDIKKMFPSIYKSLALPAIKKQLLQRGHSEAETRAVLDALEIVRDGTRVKWKEDTIKQINGCSLGPADSCDYADIALDDFLQMLVPRVESTLSMDLQFLKFFRDDGLLIFFGAGQLVLDMLEILNEERLELKFTTELCSCGNVLGCCPSCPKSVPYLDCLISVYQEELEDGTIIHQLKTTTYSKPTDIHHYIDPSSCTPKLTTKSPAIIKGVAHRLRMTNMLDDDLIETLNVYSGYLVASGYDKRTVITSFTDILSVSNRSLAFQTKEPDNSFKVALVTKMHPALPNINSFFDKFYSIISSCPVSSVILPRESLISAHRKLSPLSTILAGNPFSIPKSPSLPRGFYKSPGCSCKICKEATFCYLLSSPHMPGRSFSIPAPVSCKEVNVVYVVSCPCGLQYVGKTADPKARWSNHKSHARKGKKTCNLATHCINIHTDQMLGDTKLRDSAVVNSLLKFTILQSIGVDGTETELESVEEDWRNKLQSWAPRGLNTREDGPTRLRQKNQ